MTRSRARRDGYAIERASQFLSRSLELTADSIQQIEGGWAIRTPSLPQVWSLNQVSFAEPIPWSRALKLADEHLAGIPYLHLVAEDEIGRGFVAPLRGEGFKVEREVVMTIADGPDQGAARSRTTPAGPAVIEPDEQAVLEVVRRWVAGDERMTSAEEVEQVLQAGLREGRAWGERRFGIAGEDGKLAAITKLRVDGETAQVEDVYTVPEARGRGFARTLVAHAVRVAQHSGHDVIFIVADDEDWPKHLYARLGFRPARLRWEFHREARPRKPPA